LAIFDDETESETQEDEVNTFLIEQQLDTELKSFSVMVYSRKNIESIVNTKSFWIKFCETFPLLFKLTLILLNINSSSAFIERYFSICGAICTTKNTRMTDELLILRAMLKTNVEILRELNQKCEI
jgi:hypothetical protein